MSVLDVKRGGVPYDCGVAFKFSNAGHNKIHFALPLSIFNDGDFKIIATMRKIPDTSNLRKFEQLAFTSDENSCYFSVRNPGTPAIPFSYLRNLRMTQTETICYLVSRGGRNSLFSANYVSGFNLILVFLNKLSCSSKRIR